MSTAVDRAFRILDLFRNGQAEYSVSEVSRRLGLHKSTTHGILQTLVRRDVLLQDADSLRYRLGPGLASLGRLARQRLDLRALARPALTALAETTGETALLGVFERDGITIVDTAESQDQFRITAPAGQRLPFCAGSFGRAFLAFMDPAQVDRLLHERGLRPFTAASITDPAAYRAGLEAVRAQGYAVDDTEEYVAGVWAASAPVFDPDGVAAAFTVVALAARLTPERAQAIVRAVAAAAAQATRRLGGS